MNVIYLEDTVKDDLPVSVESALANPYAAVCRNLLQKLNEQIMELEVHVDGEDADTELAKYIEHDVLEEIETYLIQQLTYVG